MALKVFHLFLCIFFISILLPLVSKALSSAETISPFEFIEKLKGCHKGDKVNGINQLKAYLEKFGYLNSRDLVHGNDNNFDDLLESAIKTYQQNYRLKVSGTLDAQTVSTMMAPRCGVPDIINGTNWMQVGRKRHLLNHDIINAVSHYSFFPGNPKWPASKYTLTYSLKPGTRADGVSAVQRATNTWAGSTHFRFTQTQSYPSTDLKVSFEFGNHGDGAPFDGPGGVLAHAFSPTDGRLHFDGTEAWVTGAVPGKIDLDTVAAHELGHNLGLGHSADPAALMYATYIPGTTKGLNADDIQGIKALYGQ
ncbi:neutrophil collagenase [Sarracenia purpurea var. burkii]